MKGGKIMRLEKLIKSIVCASLVTAVCGVTAMAGTYTNTGKVRGCATYSDNYSGSLGDYYAGAIPTRVTTSVTSRSEASNNFCATAGVYDYNTKRLTTETTGIKALTSAQSMSDDYGRDFTSEVVDYYHNAKGYAGTSTTMVIDDFTYWGYQYYRSN